MTATDLSPADAQQAALLSELALMREQMAREREEIETERLALVAERNNAVQPASDFLEQQLREFRKANEKDDPNNVMNRPCQHVDADGAVCGLAWRTDGEITHPKTHSYRYSALKTTDAEKGKRYHLSRADMLKYGLAEPAEEVSAAEKYIDLKGAASMLGATQAQVKKLIRNESIKADTIGTVTLIHRQSVARMVALKEMQQGGDE